jgi:hypothetical protein
MLSVVPSTIDHSVAHVTKNLTAAAPHTRIKSLFGPPWASIICAIPVPICAMLTRCAASTRRGGPMLPMCM